MDTNDDKELLLQLRDLCLMLYANGKQTRSLDKPALNSNAQEYLDYLRIALKYIMFDIEATHREAEKQ